MHPFILALDPAGLTRSGDGMDFVQTTAQPGVLSRRFSLKKFQCDFDPQMGSWLCASLPKLSRGE
jgi:hypothetical protein